MAVQDLKHIILSVATSGASGSYVAGGTYRFLTSGYEPPSQPRYTDQDIVKNQNGKFKWVYDNGPGFRTWNPFKVRLENGAMFPQSATQGLADITSLWNHVGIMGFQTPDGQVFNVIWTNNALEQNFHIFPKPGVPVAQLEWEVTIQLEEA